ncbi:hypothetical protein GCM10007160_18160 [Litchfieldella qijiaojingensis]|uniref:Uncharacterized protein n=1 Tax=Litchfieldella qijiaojingensis TaxID=980347 RepID=A0ABQ2YS46_9GAMM|nr:hypothetical protein [Halomonas qijiaojingensis]GGX91054.1 hypothetical protein GCM10007160_18160 [Halomonas qijiaojingensis]
MRVHYKPKMIDKIRDEILKAKELDREIDFIELTDGEMFRFRRELNSYGAAMPMRARPFQTQIEYMGVSVVKESPVDDEEEELF